VTEDGYRSARRDELDSIVERFSRGSIESMSSAATTGDRLHKEYLVPAFTHVLKALEALPPGSGPAIEARRGEIEALRDFLIALSAGSIVLNGTLGTVAQGFHQVRTTIGNLPSRPSPTAFNEPDGKLTWLDRPPLAEYEAGVLNNLNIVRAAVADYRTDTDAALRGLRGFPTRPGDNDGDAPPAGGSPRPNPTLPLGGAAAFAPDELASATTTPLRPRANRAGSGHAGFGSTEFGPIGHAAEDAALVEERTQPIQAPGVRFGSPPPPAVYQPVTRAASTEKTIFDVDGPVVPPVIGE
jgi:hypothetical protein